MRAGDTDAASFIAAAETEAFRSLVGLTWRETGPEAMVQALDRTPAFTDDDGRISLAALAVLTDGTTGTAGAVLGNFGFAVTLNVRIELAGPLPAELTGVVATADVVRADRSGALVLARLADPAGTPLGELSSRSLAAPGTTGTLRTGGPARTVGPGADASQPTGAGLDGTLGVTAVEAEEGSSRLTVVTRPGLANGGGRLHGGIVAGLAHRAARHAVTSLTAGEPIDDLVLDVDYFRPVSPHEVEVTVTGTVRHRTRRYAWAEAEVVLPDGRLAARGRLVAGLRG